MPSVKSFLWFGGKVALSLVAIKIVNGLVAKFTGIDVLAKLDEIAGQVTG